MKTQAQHKKEDVKKTPAKMLPSTKRCMCTICILYEGSKPVSSNFLLETVYPHCSKSCMIGHMTAHTTGKVVKYMSRQDWSRQTKETVYPPLFFPTLQMGKNSVPPTLFPHHTDGEKQCTPHSFFPPYRWGKTVYPPLFSPTLQMGRKSVPPTLFPHLTDGEKQCTPHSFSPPYGWGKTVYPPLFLPTLRMGRKSGLHSFSPSVRWKSESVPPTLFSHCNKMEKKSVPPTLFFPIIEGEKVQRVRNFTEPIKRRRLLQTRKL